MNHLQTKLDFTADEQLSTIKQFRTFLDEFRQENRDSREIAKETLTGTASVLKDCVDAFRFDRDRLYSKQESLQRSSTRIEQHLLDIAPLARVPLGNVGRREDSADARPSPSRYGSMPLSGIAVDERVKWHYPKSDEYPKYDGKKESNYEDFLHKIGIMITRGKVPEGEVLAKLPIIFRGKANSWYYEKIRDPDAELKTWVEWAKLSGDSMRPTHGRTGYVPKLSITDFLRKNMTLICG